MSSQKNLFGDTAIVPPKEVKKLKEGDDKEDLEELCVCGHPALCHDKLRYGIRKFCYYYLKRNPDGTAIFDKRFLCRCELFRPKR